MSEDKKKYTLATLDENVEKEPVFYYSREHRLERASAAVRELYDDTPKKRSIIKNIFGSRGNVMTFIMIVITCFMLSYVSKYSQAGKDVKLGGNTVTMAVLKEDDVLILDIAKQSPNKGLAYTGEVEIAISPVGETQPVFFHRVVFNHAGYENFQISLPFDTAEKEFILLLRTADEQKSVKLKVK